MANEDLYGGVYGYYPETYQTVDPLQWARYMREVGGQQQTARQMEVDRQQHVAASDRMLGMTPEQIADPSYVPPPVQVGPPPVPVPTPPVPRLPPQTGVIPPDTLGAGVAPVRPAAPAAAAAAPVATQVGQDVAGSEALNAAWASEQIRRQMLIPGVIGAVQAAIPFLWKTPAEKHAQTLVEEFQAGAPEEKFRKVKTAMIEEGKTGLALSRQFLLGHFGDMAAAGGTEFSAREQRLSREAVVEGYNSGEVELVKAAYEAGQKAQDAKTMEGMQALSYISKSQVDRNKNLWKTVGQLAPVLAKIHVARGVETLSPDIDKLPDEWRDWWYRAATGVSGEEGTKELGKLYRYAMEQTARGGTPGSPAPMEGSEEQEAS